MKSLSVKLGVVIIGLAIFGYGEVWGADWKLLGSNEKISTYYDAQSVTLPSENIVRVWTKMNFTEEGVLDWVGKFGKKYENLSHLKFLMEIDRAEKKSRRLSSTFYDNNGIVISSSYSPSEWEFIIPDSVVDSLYEEVCK